MPRVVYATYPTQIQAFETIFATDLVYQPGCYELCGDAHCCHFSRYRTSTRHQELPLLPGEYEFMEQKGYLSQYKKYRRLHLEIRLDSVTISYNSLLVSLKVPSCQCRHDIRPTVCRLYPLLPLFSSESSLIGVDSRFGILEELESLASAPPACQVAALPFAELEKFLTICRAIAGEPLWVFHLMAYKITKDYCVAVLKNGGRIPPDRLSIAGAAENVKFDLIDGSLPNMAELRYVLDRLAAGFKAKYGNVFDLGETAATTAI
jgi:hypothetical protein